MLDRTQRLATWLLIAGVLVSFASVLVVQRNMIFDDSFISYRYSKNLANGFGLTWNPGEAPVEGYTNFLLVVALAPAIKLGLNPLTVTRIWSVLAALGIAWMMRGLALRYVGASRRVATLTGLAFLPIGNSFLLTTVGLETVIYVLFQFGAFVVACRLLERLEMRTVALYGLVQFGAFLLRPEALVLPVFLSVVLLLDWRKHGRQLLPAAGVIFAALVVPFLVYLAWKQMHFGTVIPAPFHVKAGSQGLLNPRGIGSVLGFARDHRMLITLAALSVLAKPSDAATTDARRQRLLATIYSGFLALFYLRVDTLMDVYQRFMYPASAFLFFLALPLVCLLLSRLLDWKAHPLIKLPGVGLLFFLVFFNNPVDSAKTVLGALRGEDRFSNPEELMQKEHQIGNTLADYEGIEQLTIAWGNAGVIPYFSGAKVIDTVGLNDRFIAENRDIDKLVDYFFERKPDLAILPTTREFEWFGGHSYLGQHIDEWHMDPRWDNYAYAGTITTHTDKIHHYFVRRDTKDFDRFFDFLRTHVVDVVLDHEPMPLGTQATREVAPSSPTPVPTPANPIDSAEGEPG